MLLCFYSHSVAEFKENSVAPSLLIGLPLTLAVKGFSSDSRPEIDAPSTLILSLRTLSPISVISYTSESRTENLFIVLLRILSSLAVMGSASDGALVNFSYSD